MAIFELFSKRQKKLRGEVPDVYQYENIDQIFRVQVVHIVQDTIGVEQSYNGTTNGVYKDIHKVLCKEYGVFTLKEYAESNFSAVFDYFLNEKSHEKCLDIIELTFRIIDTHVCRKCRTPKLIFTFIPAYKVNCVAREDCLGWAGIHA